MPTKEEALIKQAVRWRRMLEESLSQESSRVARDRSLRIVEGLVFLMLAERRKLESAGGLHTRINTIHDLEALFQKARVRYRSTLFDLPRLGTSRRFVERLSAVVLSVSKFNFGNLSPSILGKIYEIGLDGRSNGVYYTPDIVSEYIVSRTLRPLLRGRRPPAIVDPACGAGAFLLTAFDQLAKSSPANRLAILHSIHGVDIDAFGIELAKLSLLLKFYDGASPDAPVPDLSSNIRCANALVSSRVPGARPFSWARAFPAVMNSGGFDALIVNPPYVNIKMLTRQHGEALKAYFARNYTCARGAYDLYVLFLEKSLALLKPGGRLGMIVPNKLATLNYAEPCRKLLLEKTRIESIADISRLCVFSKAAVYPYILICEVSPPGEEHCIAVVDADSCSDLDLDATSASLWQSSLNAREGFRIHGGMDLESRVATEPLGQRARIHSGTTGFQAEATAEMLREYPMHGSKPYCDFIVSRNIDRYRIEIGDVRFMGRKFARPVLPLNGALTRRKAALYREPKIVVAGMSQRLEAAFDSRGLALGVQVYALAEFHDDPRYLLALLNSKLMSYIFKTRFQAKRLSGGYLSINKSQLELLPIRRIDLSNSKERAIHTRIVKCVDEMQHTHVQNAPQTKALDKEIDRCVYGLYQLAKSEISTIETAV